MNLDVPSLWVKAYTFDKSRFVWKSYKHSFREDPIKALPSVDFVQGFCSHFSFPVEDLSTSLLTLRIQWYLLSLDNQWTLLSEMPWDQGENLGWTRLIRTVLFFPFLVHRIFSFSSQFSVQDKWAKYNYRRLSFLSSLAWYLLCVHSLLIFPAFRLKEKPNLSWRIGGRRKMYVP